MYDLTIFEHTILHSLRVFFFERREYYVPNSLYSAHGTIYAMVASYLFAGFRLYLGVVLFYQRVSLVLGLFVVEVHRAEGRCGSALASLEIGTHIGVYVVGSLARFVLEVI